MQRHLVVMLKEPRPGRVKTRLARDIGRTTAAWWFRHQTAQLIRRLESPRWQIWLAVAPDAEGFQSRIWPTHLPRIAQGSGNLGHRMARVFRSLPHGPVCIIGGDIPGIQQAHIQRAFDVLGDHQAVFGPAPDGGYWLVGQKRVSPIPPTLFDGVRWSTEHALADSVTSLNGQSVALIDTLQDVDTLADLRAISLGSGGQTS